MAKTKPMMAKQKSAYGKAKNTIKILAFKPMMNITVNYSHAEAKLNRQW